MRQGSGGLFFVVVLFFKFSRGTCLNAIWTPDEYKCVFEKKAGKNPAQNQGEW